MHNSPLVIGEINYLNIWPVFSQLKLRPDHYLSFIQGHPSELNRLLAEGRVHVTPTSSFEYLSNPERYRILPHCIATSRSVQSVLFLSPVPLKELPAYLKNNGLTVNLTTASATSTSLLKIIWRLSWKFPEVKWGDVAPGQGIEQNLPFLEIGDRALEHFHSPPPGWHVIDLGQEWKKFTGLPFVWALWICLKDACLSHLKQLCALSDQLSIINRNLDCAVNGLITEKKSEFPDSLIRNYWTKMRYKLEPDDTAAIILFGELSREAGLINSVPALKWL